MKKCLLALAALIVIGVAYYKLPPLFKNIRLDEALPALAMTSGTNKEKEALTPSGNASVYDTPPANPATETK